MVRRFLGPRVLPLRPSCCLSTLRRPLRRLNGSGQVAAPAANDVETRRASSLDTWMLEHTHQTNRPTCVQQIPKTLFAETSSYTATAATKTPVAPSVTTSQRNHPKQTRRSLSLHARVYASRSTFPRPSIPFVPVSLSPLPALPACARPHGCRRMRRALPASRDSRLMARPACRHWAALHATTMRTSS